MTARPIKAVLHRQRVYKLSVCSLIFAEEPSLWAVVGATGDSENCMGFVLVMSMCSHAAAPLLQSGTSHCE